MEKRRDRRILRGMAFVLLFIPAAAGPGFSPQERPPDPSGDAGLRQRLEGANRRLLESIRRDLQKPESRPHDVAARAQLLEHDPSRIFDFVRREIRFEPYPGLQRGPAGVLVSGAGNAPDKAFLLMDLLRVSGFEARMVRGSLPRDKAEALIAAGLAAAKNRSGARSAGPFGSGRLNREKLAALFREAGISGERMARLFEDGELARRASWNDILDLTAREDEFLQGQIRAAGIEAPDPPLHEEMIRAAQTHFWVQWKTAPADPWRDADPCLVDLPAGQAAAAVDGEVSPRGIADRFTITLAMERSTGDRREKVELLKIDVPVYETLLRPLYFTIQPTHAKMPRTEAGVTAEDVFKHLAAYREFQGILKVGDEVFGSRVFDYDGKVFKVSGMGKAEEVAGAAGAAAKLFEGVAPGAAKGALESLWVDLGVAREKVPLWSQRRTILEEGRRATWCPFLSWHLFFQSHEISGDFARFMRLDYQVRNAAIREVVSGWASESGKRDWEALLRLRPYYYPVDLVDFCVARQAYVASAHGDGAQLYFDRANLFIRARQARLHETPKRVCLCYGMDIVENGASVLEAKDRYRLNRAATGALGAFDTALEQAHVREANAYEPTDGTIGFFERARALSRPVRLVQARDAQGLAGAGVPGIDAAWIQKNTEEGGFVLVSPAEPAHCGESYAWWTIHPRRGQVLGRVSGGRGGCSVLWRPRQAMPEYGFIEALNDQLMCAIGALISAMEHGAGAGGASAVACEFGVVAGAGGLVLGKASFVLGTRVGHAAVFMFEVGGYAAHQ